MKNSLLACCVVLASCFRLGPLTDNASYAVEDVSVRLVVLHAEDTLLRDNYERSYGLPGHWCRKLETVRTLDTVRPNGVAIRLWTTISMHEEGTFYGPYARHGLLDKIAEVAVVVSDSSHSANVAPHLHGDSTITSFMWRHYDRKKTGTGYYVESNHGYRNPYFRDLDAWTRVLNTRADALGEPDNYDFIFWMDKEFIDALGFEPETLSMTLTLVDSTGQERRQLTDQVLLSPRR